MADHAPAEPRIRHVWVHHSWPAHGQPVPGVVITWQRAGVESGVHPPWLALVAIQRAPGNLIVRWAPARHVRPVRDDTPAPGTRRRTPVRHLWVAPLSKGLQPTPALLVEWRRGGGGWEAQVAQAHGESMLVSWEPADRLAPITGPEWA